MEEERIDAIKAWLKPILVQNIQVFIEFANFYRHFIQSFSKIAAPLTSMLKTSLQLAGSLPATSIDNSKVVRSSGGNGRKSSKSDFTKPVRKVEEPSFPTSNTKQVFT